MVKNSENNIGAKSAHFKYNNANLKKKFCVACADNSFVISYRDCESLSKFCSAGGNKRILPSRITCLCAKHQRVLSVVIKQASTLALI